jgi:hypothetical protein
MAELSRPAAFIDRLRVAERCVKSASYRPDQKLAIREICEGVLVLIEALIAQEEKAAALRGEGTAEQKPAS